MEEEKQQIDNMISMVNELETTYEERIAKVRAEYSKDVEKLLYNYKIERQYFDTVVLEQVDELSRLKSDLKTFQEMYLKEKVEHAISRDYLDELRNTLSCEQELLDAARERIRQDSAIIIHRAHADVENEIVPDEKKGFSY